MAKQGEQDDAGTAGGLFLSAKELREYADKIDTARASKAYDGLKNAEGARKELLERFQNRYRLPMQ